MDGGREGREGGREGAVTSDVALVVMLLKQAAVVGQLLVFVMLTQEVNPRGRTAAVLRQ